MEERIEELLRSIGLGKIETQVFLDLIKNGSSTANEIAQRTKQHRSNTYDALKRLQQKGFVMESMTDEKRVFRSAEHSVMVNYLKQKQSEVESLLPYLAQISNKQTEREVVGVSYGITRVRTALLNLLDLREEILILGSPANISRILTEALPKDADRTRIKYRIPLKLIYSKYSEDISKVTKKAQVLARYLEEDRESNLSIMVCDGMTYVIVFETPVMVIEMRSKDIAEGFRAHFYEVWKKAYRVFILGRERITLRKRFRHWISMGTTYFGQIARRLKRLAKPYKNKKIRS